MVLNFIIIIDIKESDKQDIREEVVGRKIKVWWPQDKV